MTRIKRGSSSRKQTRLAVNLSTQLPLYTLAAHHNYRYTDTSFLKTDTIPTSFSLHNINLN